MKWAALIAWVITAGGGFVLLSIWLMRGGMRQQQEAGNRIRPPLILDRKSTRLNSSHTEQSRMPSSA